MQSNNVTQLNNWHFAHSLITDHIQKPLMSPILKNKSFFHLLLSQNISITFDYHYSPQNEPDLRMPVKPF